jgi:hypothetical protein
MIAFFVKWIGVFVLAFVVYTLTLPFGGLKIAFTAGFFQCSWGMVAAGVALYFGAQVTAKS